MGTLLWRIPDAHTHLPSFESLFDSSPSGQKWGFKVWGLKACLFQEASYSYSHTTLQAPDNRTSANTNTHKQNTTSYNTPQKEDESEKR